MLDPATLLQNQFPSKDCGTIVGEGCDIGFKDRRELKDTLSRLYPVKQELEFRKIYFPLLDKKVEFAFIEEQKEAVAIEEPQEPQGSQNDSFDWEAIRQQARTQMNDTNIPPVDERRQDDFGGILGTLEDAVGVERGTLFRREPPV